MRCLQPDWDMFQSKHPAAKAHAAARAVSGAAVYVSDYPGQHDFGLLKQLVLPDGSVLRARLPGRPTADCLFTDVLRDGKSLLKVPPAALFLGCGISLWPTRLGLPGHSPEKKAVCCLKDGMRPFNVRCAPSTGVECKCMQCGGGRLQPAGLCMGQEEAPVHHLHEQPAHSWH